MMRIIYATIAGVLLATVADQARAGPTPAQLCQSATDMDSAKFVKCRLTAEAKNAQGTLTGQKFTIALQKCSTNLSVDFANAARKYGAGNCTTVPPSEFDAYLTQCSDDTADAADPAAGGTLPDVQAELETCNAGTAVAADVLSSKTFSSAAGLGVAGTMADRGAVALVPGTSDQAIAAGYHNGSGTCAGDANLVADNIIAGVTLFGVSGTAASGGGSVAAAPLRTGLAQCFDAAESIPCPGTGQDAELQKGVPQALTDNGDGTVTDAATGLTWEKMSDDGTIHDKDNTYTWLNAFAVKIAALNAEGGFAGHTDWRLPNIRELHSIVNFGDADPAVANLFHRQCTPNCTVLACSCTSSTTYGWSSTTYTDWEQSAWCVDFYDGYISANGKGGNLVVRAVRGGS